ncbi:hypothetical protein [Histidinibacterium aquaticum]|uniref:Uncharacterized protein n=1 Tax=Histidinibacterium aquaticum TaxID=2613962 RepID=A0A5J5GQX0_9RHOB|nr:hypothetical protein [Histidinibacterium aquaticum]KAA9010153.1 hypothetical protein F3S47_02565 [Histidinibacterium aquaticum]
MRALGGIRFMIVGRFTFWVSTGLGLVLGSLALGQQEQLEREDSPSLLSYMCIFDENPSAFVFQPEPDGSLVLLASPGSSVTNQSGTVTAVLDGAVFQFLDERALRLEDGALVQGECVDVSTELSVAMALEPQELDEVVERRISSLEQRVIEREQQIVLADERLARADEELAEVERRLASAVMAREALSAELSSLRAATSGDRNTRAQLEDRLAEALLARSEVEEELHSLRARLSDTMARAQEAESLATERLEDAERRERLLAQANRALTEEEALSAESQRQVALLNEQLSQLRDQVGSLQSLLNMAEEEDRAADVQFEALGQQLNSALARAALAERRQREAEEEARQLRESQDAGD